MTVGDILGSLSNATNVLTMLTSGLVAVVVLKLRGDFAIFRSKLLEDISQKFLPKPTSEEDYPLTRREFSNYVAGSKPTTESEFPLTRREFNDFIVGAKEHRIALEQRLRDHQIALEQKVERQSQLEDRIRALEFDVLRRKTP